MRMQGNAFHGPTPFPPRASTTRSTLLHLLSNRLHSASIGLHSASARLPRSDSATNLHRFPQGSSIFPQNFTVRYRILPRNYTHFLRTSPETARFFHAATPLFHRASRDKARFFHEPSPEISELPRAYTGYPASGRGVPQTSPESPVQRIQASIFPRNSTTVRRCAATAARFSNSNGSRSISYNSSAGRS